MELKSGKVCVLILHPTETLHSKVSGQKPLENSKVYNKTRNSMTFNIIINLWSIKQSYV